MKVQRYKGTRDLSPEEMVSFRQIESVFRESCLKWGYQEVKTPTMEYLHLFTSAGTLTPAMLGRVYSFLDWDGWSGERVVLRPDGTIPAARFYIDRVGKGLARLFYVTNVFIFEETGKKTRERWQCGGELIGAGSTLADAELVSLPLEVLKKLKLGDIELRLSHSGLIQALLEQLGLSAETRAQVFDQILDGDEEVLAKIKSGKSELNGVLLPLLNLKGKSAGFLKNLKALVAPNLPKIVPELDNFIAITDALDALGCPYQIDIASGAGFEYYTGVVFQFFSNGEKVGGGGRYDALIPAMGGGKVPASGFALYLDRLMNKVKIEAAPVERVLVRPASDEAEVVKLAFSAADALRNAGRIAEVGLDDRLGDTRWILAVQKKDPQLVLEDRVKSSRTPARNIGEVLKLLEAERASKNRLT